jgi:hypothetical protein
MSIVEGGEESESIEGIIEDQKLLNVLLSKKFSP